MTQPAMLYNLSYQKKLRFLWPRISLNVCLMQGITHSMHCISWKYFFSLTVNKHNHTKQKKLITLHFLKYRTSNLEENKDCDETVFILFLYFLYLKSQAEDNKCTYKAVTRAATFI